MFSKLSALVHRQPGTGSALVKALLFCIDLKSHRNPAPTVNRLR